MGRPLWSGTEYLSKLLFLGASKGRFVIIINDFPNAY